MTNISKTLDELIDELLDDLDVCEALTAARSPAERAIAQSLATLSELAHGRGSAKIES